MGKGGRMSVQPVANTEAEKNESIVRRVPHQKPPFTIADIKKAIPPHCFNRSLIRSSSYLVFDIAVCFFLYYIATNYISLLPAPLSYVAWTAYVYVQGCFMFAIWVVAHECGHHGFSDYHLLNDTLGFILHSLLLVPYFSWKISHRRHHANTNSLDRDENHVPRFKNTIRSYYHHFNNPLGRVFIITFTLTLGWPLYLIVNIAGRSYDRVASHFDPYSPIYSERERLQIMLSDLGFVAACYGLYRIALVKGFAWVFLVYGAPLHVVNGFLVMITLLHHTHLSLPHYDSSEWDWLRGALATVDRDYGILNKVFHHIADTHVLHHLISSIPHYHAQEATEAIKPVLGEYYHYDGTPFYKAMWREAKECLYVEEEDEGDNKTKGVYWYKNKL
ncbi:hypothetical protein DCAR_0313218 [Daucus carota subsp. sativus]|uniref:Fatty acid desaturase domain-containing protein n=1 Tax=Daucus carota subsp. sativus TaxID=79200 RepID=A0A162ALP8_DAUCS|nr:PREDICTED: delta(12)-fatty-acid desaturase FAD2-like [Daucus carota subsp. sativus]WOG93930.1 hypothetical protein DCAR_0313218 [Daucus carota subsp. sativus]